MTTLRVFLVSFAVSVLLIVAGLVIYLEGQEPDLGPCLMCPVAD